MEDGVGKDAVQQGLKKAPSGNLRQVDSRLAFWEKQLLQAHLINGQASNKSFSDKIVTYDKQEMAQSKENRRVAYPKDKMEFKIFPSPDSR